MSTSGRQLAVRLALAFRFAYNRRASDLHVHETTIRTRDIMRITILGCGLVGNAIARDLVADAGFEITAVDVNRDALDRLAAMVPVETVQANLQEADQVGSSIEHSDLVVCAVPGFMGYATLERIIEAGKNVVDISFFGEDPFELDQLARNKGVTAVVDCGVAPGLSNIIAGYLDTQLEEIDRFVCYVGGLPKVRQWPYEYKAVFSPRDVLEEYTRLARFVEFGQEVVRPALSEVELRDFPNAGTLEAFNTDGLRTLQHTMKIPFMKEKTLRYPGHANVMRIFRDSGFFRTDTIEVDGQQISPIAMTSKLLFDQWRLREGEEDFTVFQVVVEGRSGHRRLCYTYNMLDEYDRDNQTTSMARTTGYTCTIVVRQVLRGLFTQKGICPPEYIGRTPGCFGDLLGEYAKRNILLDETVTEGSE
ncbi:MAG: saccharopine dehydrogenase C-terminal domain-containing protein [Candidatus Latescibacterota bacterium]